MTRTRTCSNNNTDSSMVGNNIGSFSNDNSNSSSGNNNKNDNNSSSSSSTMQACAACKHQRRKCSAHCPLAPYFPPHRSQQFLCVHRLFGVSNVLRILRHIHPSTRPEAIDSIIYEAEAWVRDPIFGCVGILLLLQLHAQHLRLELSLLRHRAFDLLRNINPSIASPPPLDFPEDLTNDDEDDCAIVPAPTFADDITLHVPVLYSYGGHEEAMQNYGVLHAWDERLYDLDGV